MKERPILFSAAMVRAILSNTKTQTRRVVKQATGLSLSVSIPDDTPGVAELSWLWGDGPGYDVNETIKRVACPYGQPGDRLWVRETYFAWGRWETRFSVKKGRDEWHFIDMTQEAGQSYLHAADGVSDTKAFIKRRGGVLPMYWKRPSIHMPRWASRITLEVTGVRVERLMDISEADAKAEGCARLYDDEPGYVHRDEPDWSLCPQCGGTRLYTAFNPATGGAIPDTDCEKCDTYVKRYQHLWTSINGPESWVANPWVWAIEFKVMA